MTFADHLCTHQDAHNGGGEMPISYGSVCSGIEAASVAWHHLGWIPRWFAEIEPSPSAVLAHHWPEVSNLGDFTAIRDKVAAGTIEAPDVLVGGTPCQAFSVAGLRQSLDDKRGQLTIEFVRLADAIDSARSFRGQRPVTVVWENVPGVLNTPDNAFGCFLGALAGEEDEIVPGDCPPTGKSSRFWVWSKKIGRHVPCWPKRGLVSGPSRTITWRVLDAQYFGVAQRRRRVFVVASAGGIRPEQVLFEFDGVRRDSPPRREAGKGFAADAGTLAANGGGLTRPAGNCNELDFCVPVGVSEGPDLAHCLRSGASKADKHESTTYVQTAMQVRRLTPTECERLQGFPDGHTRIPWRGKPAEECPDGPRYKALGNSMAVPVMRWIGARIARQLEAQA